MESVKKKVEYLGIADDVLMVGLSKEIPALLSSFDALLFPSLYEGMPNVVIEAQATGLPCLISDTISNDVKVTNLVNFCSLGKSANEWAKKLDDVVASSNNNNRSAFSKILQLEGYSITQSVEILTQLLN